MQTRLSLFLTSCLVWDFGLLLSVLLEYLLNNPEAGVTEDGTSVLTHPNPQLLRRYLLDLFCRDVLYRHQG